MPPPNPCLVKTRLRRSQRCTSLASLPRFKLFLKNGAGGVHDQLWQKSPVETNERIRRSIRGPSPLRTRSRTKEEATKNNSFVTVCLLRGHDFPLSISTGSTRDRVDYQREVSEN